MPNVNPGLPPGGTGGTTSTPDKFPQWGVANPSGNLTSPGDKIAEAASSAQKVKLIDQGYVAWFASKKAAQDWIKQETGAFSGNLPSPLHGLDAIGNFFSELGQANTWIRVGEVLIGIVLIGIGLARITGAQNLISQAVKTKLPV